MNQYKIVGIALTDRIKEANRTQAVLSKYAHLIRSRLGFHEVSEYTCSRVGFIILQIIDENNEFQSFKEELEAIGGIEVQVMSFNF